MQERPPTMKPTPILFINPLVPLSRQECLTLMIQNYQHQLTLTMTFINLLYELCQHQPFYAGKCALQVCPKACMHASSCCLSGHHV